MDRKVLEEHDVNNEAQNMWVPYWQEHEEYSFLKYIAPELECTATGLTRVRPLETDVHGDSDISMENYLLSSANDSNFTTYIPDLFQMIMHNNRREGGLYLDRSEHNVNEKDKWDAWEEGNLERAYEIFTELFRIGENLEEIFLYFGKEEGYNERVWGWKRVMCRESFGIESILCKPEENVADKRFVFV